MSSRKKQKEEQARKYYVITRCDETDEDDVPEGCAACGGPYPRCCASCPLFDD